MRRLQTVLLLTLTLAALPAPAEEIYRWVDADGEVHYTNDPATIPPALRKKAKVTQGAELLVVEPSKEDAPPPAKAPGKAPAKAPDAPPAKAAPAPAPAKSQPPAPPDDGGEARWRSRFRAAHDEIAQLARDAEADRTKLSSPEAGGVGVVYNARGAAVPNPELDRIREHLARTEQALEDAQRHLDDLEREASRESVPREWRR